MSGELFTKYNPMKATAIILAACFLLVGCQTVSPQEITALDPGLKPDQQAAETNVRGYLTTALKDYDTARINFHPVRKGWQKDGSLRGGKLHAGWMLVVDVNAKNSYGGYTGFKRYWFFFEGGSMYHIEQFLIDNKMAGFAD